MGAFKSKAQLERFKEMEKSGEIAQGTTEQWTIETPSIGDLPERLHPKAPRKAKTNFKYQPMKKKLKGYS